MPPTPKKAKKKVELTEVTPKALAAQASAQFGEGVASTGKIYEAKDYISTQSALIDYALGRNGIPTGGITNIYGEEGSGKSTVAYHLIAECQDRGGIAVLYDAEGAYQEGYERAGRMGIDHDQLILLEPPTLEDAFDVIENMIVSTHAKNPRQLMLIVIDSVASSVTKAMLEGGYGDSHPAAQARTVSQALPKLLPHVIRSNTAIVMVGQLRAQLTVGPSWGGPKMTQVAEGALRYYSFVRMYFRQSGELGDDDKPTGIESFVDVKKNKTAPPFRTARFNIDFNYGIDKVHSKLMLAKELGLVTVSGGWYKYGESSFHAADFGPVLEANPELEELLEAAPLLWQEKLS